MKQELNLKFFGNEVYYTACPSLVRLKSSCSKLHSQKGFNSIPFSNKGVRAGEGRDRRPGWDSGCRSLIFVY